jgi:hypothetical protein
MNELILNFGSNGAVIYCVKELNAWKEIISPDEKRLKEDCIKYARDLKYVKGFKSFVIDFDSIDYYDHHNSYEIPKAKYISRTAKIEYVTFWDVPKAWEKSYNLNLEDITNIRPLKKFIEVMGLNINEKQLNKFRKAIKERTYCNIEL